MQNTYQEKLADLEVNNSKKIKKLEGGINFKIKSDFQPSGDQPEAIKQILKNLKDNKQEQVLLGVTGSGKTFTMAKVIEKANRPALILAPNKTLAAQLYGEFKSFFPDNAVEYFVSPFLIASIAASLILSGVSKSGSPAPNPITSFPAALISLAFEVTAIVGDGFIRFKLLETMLIEIYNIINLLLTQNAKYLSRKIS